MSAEQTIGNHGLFKFMKLFFPILYELSHMFRSLVYQI